MSSLELVDWGDWMPETATKTALRGFQEETLKRVFEQEEWRQAGTIEDSQRKHSSQRTSTEENSREAAKFENELCLP